MVSKKSSEWRPYLFGTVALLLAGFAIDRLVVNNSKAAEARTVKAPLLNSQSNAVIAKLTAGGSSKRPPAEFAVKDTSGEGKISTVQINVGPFDIHRKYRSMEGPFVDQTFTIADLLESKKITLPEPMVRWVEQGGKVSMTGGDNKGNKEEPAGANPVGLVYADISKRELYWLKGVKLQVLDENDKVLPTGEFICHMNLDVAASVHDAAFKTAEKVSNTRLITLTQGQTEIKFPDGYGVPVASFEPFRFTFQAANRTTDAHRRLKHLCTLEFIKDSDLKKPLTALAWYAPYIAVNIDKTPNALAPDHEMHGPSCLGNSAGTTAPNFVNGSVIKNNGGEHLVGHWAIPPGVNTYTSPITDERDYGFNHQDRIVHAVWSHIHPMCEEATLSVCDGSKKTPIWTVHSQTDTSHGLEIKHIDDLYSAKGIVLPKDKHYELSATYANTTGQLQDSMVVQGIFYEDKKFSKPNFNEAVAEMAAKANATKKGECNSLYCGIKPTEAQQARSYGGSDIYPLFAAEGDGPLLTSARHVQVRTSSGNLNITLDPSVAPATATQMYRLFQAGAFGGTTICNYEPEYFLQIGAAYQKRNADYRLPGQITEVLRRLPLEVKAQEKGKGLHKKYALDMTRNDADDSGVSSFSIMLADEPHLDHKFTVFGFVDQDKESLATIEKITSHWSADKLPYVVSATDKQSNWLATAPLEATKSSSSPADSEAKTAIAAGSAKTGKGSERASESKPHPLASLADRTSFAPEALPIFDAKADGPLLNSPEKLTMETSAGNIHIVLDPALAPKNATQMYQLFKAGAFSGTGIVRYEPNFVLQTAVAETKANGQLKSDDKIKQLLRRLPLEVACQEQGKGLHQKWALSMAHGDDPNSATTSFSILLGDAPHLDHKYTVFGHVIPDDETKATISKITSAWNDKHPHVINVKININSIALK